MAIAYESALRFTGKVFLVAGGASGIGAAIAGRLEAEGAEAVIRADISAPPAGGGSGPGTPIRLDIADAASIAKVVGDVLAAHGRIDGLVNSAGIAKVAPFVNTAMEDYHRILGVNLRGAFLLGQAVARHMVERRRGVILNLGSVSGSIGNEGRSAYGASKAALVQLSKTMALELRPHGIRVNVLAPGPVLTPLAAQNHSDENARVWLERVPLHRYGEPSEMASAAAFLCSDDARLVSGHVMAADGGFLAAGLHPAAAAAASPGLGETH